MRGLITFCFLTVGVLLALDPTGSAQGPPSGKRKSLAPRQAPAAEQPSERRGPPDWERRPGADFRSPSFEMFSDNQVVKGAPYTAMAITETVQTLAGGAKIAHKKTGVVYRDSEGRTRREQTFDRVGPFSMGGTPRQLIFINDVVAGSRIFLDPAANTARKFPNFDRPAPPYRPPGSSSDTERKNESLGKQVIEGIEAEGTRTTITIAAGKIGNDRPLEIISERWESPELQIVVLSKHKDPFAGETTYRLTDIKRSEPPHMLFEIPAEYAIEQENYGRTPWDNRRKRPQDQ